MKMISFYDEAHIFTAAVRLFEFKHSASPSHADISELTGMNIDRVSHIALKLANEAIIDMVDGPFNTTCFMISNHLKIEQLEKQVQKNRLAEELKNYQEQTKNIMEKKVLQFTEEKKQNDKKLFDELSKKLQEKAQQNKS